MSQLVLVIATHGEGNCPALASETSAAAADALELLPERISEATGRAVEQLADCYDRARHTFFHLLSVQPGTTIAQAVDGYKRALGLERITVTAWPVESREQACAALRANSVRAAAR